jgi:iron complex transport system substrate-binding protein
LAIRSVPTRTLTFNRMSISITECLPRGGPPRRPPAAALLGRSHPALLGVALLLGGCGSDGGTPASEARQDGETSAFPAAVAQKLGEVTIEAEPKRVVALDFRSADNAIALGVVPVAMAEVS